MASIVPEPVVPMQTIWKGATVGADDVLKRTPIMITPAEGEYSTMENVPPQKVANWQARGMTVLAFTPDQLDRMRQLRDCSMEYAAISGNKYIPPGYYLEDLLRLYAADRPLILTEHDTHLRSMAAVILQMKKENRMLITRMHQVENKVQEHAVLIGWQADEGNGNGDVPEQAPHNVQNAAVAAQQGQPTNVNVPQGFASADLLTPQTPHVQSAVLTPASDSGSSQSIAKLNYMKKLQLFQGNKPAYGQDQRAWQEWEGEFVQNAKLCRLDEDMYYDMAEALLSNHMREVWLTYLKVKPEDGTWAGMKAYMGVHYAALDKTVEARKKFEDTKLQESTEKAWQTYCNAQASHISDMGSATQRRLTDSGIWETFLANISGVPDVHATAFQAYTNVMEGYDILPVQARITKLTPVLLTYLKSKAAVNTSHAGSGMATGGQHGSKRHAESLGGAQNQRQRILEPVVESRNQPESNTVYHAVPTDVDFLKCPDVGYQSEHESKPYNHSLRRQLQASGRCLVCWSNTHRIGDCPHRSQGMKDDMEVKKQIQRNAGGFRGGSFRRGSSSRVARGWRGRHYA